MKWFPGERNLLLVAVFIFLKSCKELSAVQVLSVKVPPRVKSGNRVSLSCLFDLQGKSLYSLNWWKDNQQFYEFSPSSPEPKTIYETPGIDVMKSESSLKEVMLRNVTQATSGEFKCEIVADYPSYEKDSLTAFMQVIEVPSSPPQISVDRINYRVGDLLEANCTSEGSDPSPSLHWLINGQKINPKFSRVRFNRKDTTNDVQTELKSSSNQEKYPTERPIIYGNVQKKEDSLSSPRQQRFSPVATEVFLEMKPIHFMHGGRASLTCVASIPGLYDRKSTIQLTLPGISPVEPSQRVSSGSRSLNFSSWFLGVLLATYNITKFIFLTSYLKWNS